MEISATMEWPFSASVVLPESFLCVSCVYSHFPEEGLREETETLEIRFHYSGRNNNNS